VIILSSFNFQFCISCVLFTGVVVVNVRVAINFACACRLMGDIRTPLLLLTLPLLQAHIIFLLHENSCGLRIKERLIFDSNFTAAPRAVNSLLIIIMS